MKYYERLSERCKQLGQTEFIGKTTAGYDIPFVDAGSDTLIVGSTHAREHITTELIFGIFDGTYPIDVVPCLNIDGVILCREGLSALPISAEKKEFLRKINGSNDFSLWKANANAVDINVNFDAEWGTGKSNVKYPSSANFIGTKPESESETKAICDLIRRKKYSQVISYHSKGEVIYWGFGKNKYHYSMAKKYADILGYPLTTSYGSAGGLKDWFDMNSDGLGLTVEVGNDKFSHPYPESELPNLISLHKRSVKTIYENGLAVAKKIHAGSSS